MTAEEKRIFYSISPLAEEIRVILFEADCEIDGIIVTDAREKLLTEINRVWCLCRIAARLTDALVSRVDALEKASLRASEKAREATT